jgi:hypothetical protein
VVASHSVLVQLDTMHQTPRASLAKLLVQDFSAQPAMTLDFPALPVNMPQAKHQANATIVLPVATVKAKHRFVPIVGPVRSTWSLVRRRVHRATPDCTMDSGRISLSGSSRIRQDYRGVTSFVCNLWTDQFTHQALLQ